MQNCPEGPGRKSELPRHKRRRSERIIKRYGDTLDLRKSPCLFVEIIREFVPGFPGLGPGAQSGTVFGSHGIPSPPPPRSADMAIAGPIREDLLRPVANLERKL